MNLKCQLTDNPCDNEAMWIMITGCTEGHLEETPLCTTHLNHWKDCAEHKNLSILYCMCHEKVIEYDYTPISKVTQQWIYEYTSKLTDELPLSNIVAPHPTGNPSIPPSSGLWLGTGKVKNTNIPEPWPKDTPATNRRWDGPYRPPGM